MFWVDSLFSSLLVNQSAGCGPCARIPRSNFVGDPQLTRAMRKLQHTCDTSRFHQPSLARSAPLPAFSQIPSEASHGWLGRQPASATACAARPPPDGWWEPRPAPCCETLLAGLPARYSRSCAVPHRQTLGVRAAASIPAIYYRPEPNPILQTWCDGASSASVFPRRRILEWLGVISVVSGDVSLRFGSSLLSARFAIPHENILHVHASRAECSQGQGDRASRCIYPESIILQLAAVLSFHVICGCMYSRSMLRAVAREWTARPWPFQYASARSNGQSRISPRMIQPCLDQIGGGRGCRPFRVTLGWKQAVEPAGLSMAMRK